MALNGIKIDGLQGLEDVLGNIAPREARNLNRSTIHGMAGIVRDAGKKNAPKDEGTLKKAIKAKRRRPKNPDAPYSDVIVERGRSAKHDAFYWKFVYFGTEHSSANPFFQPGIDHLRSNVSAIYRDQFMKKLAKLLERKARQNRK